MRLRTIFRLRTFLALLTAGFATFLASMILETFIFRRIVKTRPALAPWNRELNALSLILAAIIGGALAVHVARSFSLWTLTRDEEEQPELLVAFAAAGVAILLWLLRYVVAENPLTVGWRGILTAAAGAAAGGSLVAGGRARWIAWPALLVTAGIGFGTVSYDYYEYPVTIVSDRALLRGEVTVPGRSADATHPGVLLVHDWGQQDRDATWGANKPFRELAEHLALNGYAVLRYDKRGSGESSGVFTQLGLQDFAKDAASAGSLLAAQNVVKGQPLFTVGHGFGGQAATMAVMENPEIFAGLALLATPASPVSDWLHAQERHALTTLGATPQELDARQTAVDEWLEGIRGRRFLNYGDYFGSRGIAEDLQTEQLARPLPPVWLRQAMDHDQAAALAEVPLPILILTGEADWRVPPSEAAALVGALTSAGRSDWTLHRLPRINHQLVEVESTEKGFLWEQSDAYMEEQRPIAPSVLDALTNWLDQWKDS